MQSRRDQLYIRPWEQRRYKDHRAKVHSAVPAIDARAPPPRPHVAVKLKKCQRESDRARNVVKENFALLQRLNAIMKVNRLDNKWVTPQPNFHNKVGVFFPVGSASRRLRLTARNNTADDDGSEDHSEVENNNVKCYACHQRKKSAAVAAGSKSGELLRCRSKYQECLPGSIYF